MKNYLLAFLLALLVVLTGMSLRRSAAGIGGSPVPMPPNAIGIGGSPVPMPPNAIGMGTSPVPMPPNAQ
jgi:hypothetical protein